MVLRRWLLSTLVVGAASALGCRGCNSTPSEPGADGGASVAATARTPIPRDDAGHLIPRSSPPPPPPDAPPKPLREPDWDLDSDDAARDYVRRYALGTKRYGDTLDCVDVAPSEGAGDRRRVEVRVRADCASTSKLGDVFLVDVAGDRLTVDDKTKRNPLARWPDGSDPEGPAGDVRQLSDLRKWSGPLGDAFHGMMLVPVRVQAYGRGTYPVVTIAGWHGELSPAASAEELQPTAAALCKANGGPLGIFANIDRSRMLRIRCPGTARWDRL
jgi:hypothetical protein